MTLIVRKIPRRWQCRFGRHRWELVVDERWGGHWYHCFSCGKERGR